MSIDTKRAAAAVSLIDLYRTHQRQHPCHEADADTRGMVARAGRDLDAYLDEYGPRAWMVYVNGRPIWHRRMPPPGFRDCARPAAWLLWLVVLVIARENLLSGVSVIVYGLAVLIMVTATIASAAILGERHHRWRRAQRLRALP